MSGAIHGALTKRREWGSPRAGDADTRRKDFGPGLTQPDAKERSRAWRR